MRVFLLRVITVLMASIFLYRLLDLQVVNTSYQTLSENNAVLEIAEYPERGFIYDRNGKLLVANQPAYDVMIIPENVSPFDTLSFCELTGISKKRLIYNLKKRVDIQNACLRLLLTKSLKKPMQSCKSKCGSSKVFLSKKKSLRNYRVNYGANVLGYVSEVNNNDLKKDDYYQLGEIIGRQGVEKSYEKHLRGVKGKRFLQKDRFNRILGTYKEGIYDVAPTPAKNITLTLDAQLQAYGEKLMQNKRGGIVAIEPATGEVLALVNAPSYDPSILVGRKRSYNYRKLANDTLAKPLFDRGLLAQYPPGSPFKTLNALIALQEECNHTKNKASL